MQHEGLQAGSDEQQHGVEVALPVWGLRVIHKLDEQPAKEQREGLECLVTHGSREKSFSVGTATFS